MRDTSHTVMTTRARASLPNVASSEPSIEKVSVPTSMVGQLSTVMQAVDLKSHRRMVGGLPLCAVASTLPSELLTGVHRQRGHAGISACEAALLKRFVPTLRG
jgi:hypothetical protein